MYADPFTDEVDGSDEPLTPFPVLRHSYFTPTIGSDLGELAEELSRVSALGEVTVARRDGGPTLSLRAGALEADIRGGSSLARSLVRAMNELLARARILDRFVPLEWMGGGEAFISADMDSTLDLYSGGYLAVEGMADLMDITAW